MCGIAGYVNLDGAPADPGLLKRMGDSCRHRGPDDEGYFHSGNVGFVHRRLSVIDIAGGIQPMRSEDGSAVLVFNGEIFNFQELRSELKGKGHSFRTNSDTEVLLRLYEEYGTGFLHKLNGFFAFAVYDAKKSRIFIARDRLGVKPLYYLDGKKQFGFASELSALKLLPSFEPENINLAALVEYMSLQYVPGPLTIYRNIKKLSPGHFLEFDLESKTIKTESYWTLDYNRKTDLSYRDARAQLREIMHDAVRKRLIADVPLGVFLSGGLDSAVIASIAARETDAPLQCFSIGFPSEKYDETDLSRETAEFIRKDTGRTIEHHIKTVDPSDFDLLPLLASHFGEPYADASMLPTYLLSAFTREHVTVALSGDGADELFAGYERYLAMKYLRRMRFLPRFAWKLFSKTITGGGERTFSGRLKRLLSAASLRRGEQYFSIISHRADDLLPQLCEEDLLIGYEALYPTLADLELLHESKAKNFVESFMEFDLFTYLPGDILPKVDIASMATSLEVRSPFLDYRAVEFAASLPLKFKQKGKTRKRILADAFAEYLPPGIGNRPKKGFGVPIADWFRTVWKDQLQERLLEGKLLNENDYFRKDAVSELLSQHCGGDADHSYLLFSLLMLELFFELDD